MFDTCTADVQKSDSVVYTTLKRTTGWHADISKPVVVLQFLMQNRTFRHLPRFLELPTFLKEP
jgi:hypothetical protein